MFVRRAVFMDSEQSKYESQRTLNRRNWDKDDKNVGHLWVRSF